MSIKLEEAITILKTLSDESDRETKEALKLALFAIDELKRRSDNKKNRPKAYGTPWTRRDEEQIIPLFREKKSISEIAKILQRGEGAVARKLITLGEAKSLKELKGR